MDPEREYLRFLENPSKSRPTRRNDQRPVESKTLTYATLEAFHTFIPQGRYPPAILFLNIDPSRVDVNVHPAKKEIRFREDAKVRNFLLGSLLDRNRSFHDEGRSTEDEPKMEVDLNSERLVPQIDPAALNFYGLKEKDLSKETNDSFKKVAAPFNYSSGQDKVPLLKNLLKNLFVSTELITEKFVSTKGDGLASWRFIDRPKNDLALFSATEGLVALHVRAAY